MVSSETQRTPRRRQRGIPSAAPRGSGVVGSIAWAAAASPVARRGWRPGERAAAGRAGGGGRDSVGVGRRPCCTPALLVLPGEEARPLGLCTDLASADRCDWFRWSGSGIGHGRGGGIGVPSFAYARGSGLGQGWLRRLSDGGGVGEASALALAPSCGFSMAGGEDSRFGTIEVSKPSRGVGCCQRMHMEPSGRASAAAMAGGGGKRVESV